MDRPADQSTRTFDATTAVSTASGPPPVPDRWDLVRLVGRGGQGQVWLAEDRQLRQEVALKVVPCHGGDRVGERALREARMGRSLEHPNLVRVFDLVTHRDCCIVVMEWLDGASLHAALADGPLPIARVEEVAEAVLKALAYLHRQGVVHRDVKTSNILFSRSGQTKLGDLGLLRGPQDEDLTRTGSAVGTPAYMSPEVLRAERPGPPSDLYALGVTLFELLTGEKPFGDGSDAAVVHAHLRRQRPAVRRLRLDCPRWLASFVQRLIERSPRDRFPDAAAALAVYGRRRVVASRRRRRVATALAAGLATILTVAALWTSRAGVEPRSVAVLDDAIVAMDADGEELWRLRPGGTPILAQVADVHDGRSPEVVYAESHQEESFPRRRRTWIVVVDAAGQEVTRLEAGTRLGEPEFPGMSLSAGVEHLLAADLDGDGRDDLAWVAAHPDWYPSAVEVWLGRGPGRVVTRLVNSGHIRDLLATDMDEDGDLELVATGLNNPLGFQLFVAVLEVGTETVWSPDHLFGRLNLPPDIEGVRSYVLLGPELSGHRIVSAGPQGIVVDGGGETTALSPLGVPVRSAAAAVPAPRRTAFWRDLVLLARHLERRPSTARDPPADLQAEHPRLLAESGTRLAADLLLARALAEGGGHRQAVELLRAAVARDPEPGDRWLRLGEQLLLLGDRDDGRRSVQRSVNPVPVGRNAYDALMILGLDAALHGDKDGLEDALELTPGTPPTSADLDHALLEAFVFCRGTWNDPALDPGGPVGVYHWTRVLRWWGQLERGAPPDEVAGVARRLAAVPEIREPALLLEARATLALGQVDRARALARESLTTLRRRARTSYEQHFWVPLAEAVYGDCLLAAEQDHEARDHWEQAATMAPDTWFGRHARRRLN